MIHRRTLLRGVGTAVALPLLQSMRPAAAAATGKSPLRVAFLYTPNGAHMPDWRPVGQGEKLRLGATHQALTPYQDQLNVLSGLTLDGARAHGDGGGDHARSVAAFLTGAHPHKTDGANIKNGVSIDQVIAQSVATQTRFASLELGLEPSATSGRCDTGYSCAYASNMSWRGPTNPMAKEHDPRAVFDRLFAGQTKRETGRAVAEREKHRTSVLDYVLEDAKALQPHLPAIDRRKLDEYLYSVRDIEKRLNGPDKLHFGEDGVPDFPRPSGVPRELAEHSALMMDMMTLAFQTDSTRVISFMFANAASNRPYREIGVNEGHHELSHHGGSEHKQTEVAKINRFHVERFAELLQRLRATPEGEGTLLDHCLIVYGSGISDGDRHNHDDLPIILAGGGGGRVRGGRHLSYDKETPLCNLYADLATAMGNTTQTFGDSNGSLRGLIS